MEALRSSSSPRPARLAPRGRPASLRCGALMLAPALAPHPLGPVCSGSGSASQSSARVLGHTQPEGWGCMA